MSVKNKYPHLEHPELPRLPVPDLQATIAKYLQTIRPLVNEEGYADTVERVDEFMAGEGPRLHAEMQRLATETPTSYLEGFWDTAYLAARCCNPININPSFAMGEDPKGRDMCQRAASVITTALLFHGRIRTPGELPQDTERRQPLCMCQYGKLFGSTRVPQVGRDVYAEFPYSRHIIIICRRRFYVLNVFRSDGNVHILADGAEVERELELEETETESELEVNPPGEPEPELYSEGEFVYLLRSIVADACRRPRIEFPVGALTSQNRDVWAKDRVALLADGASENLRLIETALFCLVLEDEVDFSDRNVMMKCLLHGDAGNRWFDKSLQFVVGSDGRVGLNMEHSAFDGHTTTVMFHYMYQDEVEREIPEEVEVRGYQPNPIQFVLGRGLQEAIVRAQKTFREFVGTTSLHTINFEQFGKRGIIECNCSPDAFLQMAFQLTFSRLHEGKMGSTYESANTKRFYHGRTECIRSLSVEAAEFARVFNDPHAPLAAKDAACRRAIKTHVESVRAAKQGLGIDRHMYVMKKLACHKKERLPDYDMPRIYSGEAYSKLTTDLMSTSNCSGSPGLTWFAFGPVSAHCFGCGYVISNDALHLSVSNFDGRAEEYAAMFAKCCVEMRDTLLEAQATQQQ